jgi:hypothetical protein
MEQTKPTTRAEEIAAEGPYKVERYTRGIGKLEYFRVIGPSETGVHSVLTRYIAERQAKLLNRSYKQGQQDRWISAKDRLPKEGERVLATDGDTVGEVLYVHYGANTRTALAFRRTTTGPVLDDVTHWQLLPTPPNPEQR